MIFPFPYTNLYNLNLDWMIKTMKEMQEIVEPLSRVVNSVNGMTGDVQITKQFLLQILESMVSKFNGRAGDVTLTAADVNSTMIDITWTSDPGDVIEDIAQNVRDQLYAIGKRVLIFVNNQGVPDQIYFLTLVGDVVTPQIYSPTAALAGVASFNGQTGNVTATGSNLDTANDDDTPISESIGNLQNAVGHQSQQIGNVALPTTAQTLTGAIAEEKQLIDNAFASIAYVETGTTASRAYAKGDYVIVQNILYIVATAIAESSAFTVNTNIKPVGVKGGLNALKYTKLGTLSALNTWLAVPEEATELFVSLTITSDNTNVQNMFIINWNTGTEYYGLSFVGIDKNLIATLYRNQDAIEFIRCIYGSDNPAAFTADIYWR